MTASELITHPRGGMVLPVLAVYAPAPIDDTPGKNALSVLIYRENEKSTSLLLDNPFLLSNSAAGSAERDSWEEASGPSGYNCDVR